MQTLADLAGLSVPQLKRHFHRVFLLTPRQALRKVRSEAAMRLLHSDGSVASISATCGSTDQSAFTRRFRSTVGTAPRAYRAAIANQAIAAD
jgi:AraC-like DNA-binding protein